MDAKKFGEFIAEVRKQQNMTQAELAAKLRVTDKAVSRWERGLGFPDINTIEPLAEALGLSVLEIMRSERIAEEPPSEESVSQALSDTLGLARREKTRQEGTRNGVLTGICFGLLLSTLLRWQVGSVAAKIIFFTACLAALICGYYLLEERDKIMKDVARIGIIAAIGVAVISGRNLIPAGIREQYENWTIIAYDIYLLVTVIAAIVQVFLKKPRGKAVTLAVGAVACVLCLIFCFTLFGKKIQSMSDVEAQRRTNAVQQYASALFTGEQDIPAEQITGTATIYLQETDDLESEYMVIFSYRLPGEDTDRSYGYDIAVAPDSTYRIREQGEALGERYVTVQEE